MTLSPVADPVPGYEGESDTITVAFKKPKNGAVTNRGMASPTAKKGAFVSASARCEALPSLSCEK